MPPVNVPHRPEHLQIARDLVREARANDGLAPVNLERFWADQTVSSADPFSKTIPQCPLGMLMSGECVYDELGIEEDFRRYGEDAEWRVGLNKAYNDKAEATIGRRLLGEVMPDSEARHFPAIKGLNDLFEAENEWHAGSWWLQQSASGEDELAGLLDRVEARLDDLRSFLLPPAWDEEKAGLLAAGATPPRYRGQRGPITFACSIYGAEDFIFLMADNEMLAGRFRDVLLRSMLGMASVLDAEHDDTPETAPRGFYFCDDSCCLLTPDMYEFFGYPILKGMWDVFSPEHKDSRYQHSDSAMGHLLPLLARLDLNGVNFGPTVMPDEIRHHLPNALIQGQLAPFTLSRNEEENIVLEFLRDFEMTRELRGLSFSTAGSINNGSRLTSMRLIMAAIQRYGRYDS